MFCYFLSDSASMDFLFTAGITFSMNEINEEFSTMYILEFMNRLLYWVFFFAS